MKVRIQLIIWIGKTNVAILWKKQKNMGRRAQGRRAQAEGAFCPEHSCHSGDGSMDSGVFKKYRNFTRGSR